MTSAGRPAAVVDTNVFGAELTRRGARVGAAYRRHFEGRDLFISFVSVAELRFGARLAGWGAHRLRRLEARVAGAEVVWSGEGLIDAHVSLRHECTVSGHPLGQKHHEADRWIAATARWLDVPLIAHDAVFHDAPGVTLLTELA
ncbi:MAG TPA: PIN domain-containing protein [Acidimicrobiales bacterium]|nr:PIN domain-containing protein [Acidimicrobiales bacterium]